MKTLIKSLLTTAVASLMAFPAMGQEVKNDEPVRSEFNYRYENTQGALEGDRVMQRDRDQVRDRLQDPKMSEEVLQTRDQVRLQDRVDDPDPLRTHDRAQQQDRIHDPDMAEDQASDATRDQARIQEQTQTRNRLMQDRTDDVGSQAGSMTRSQHSFTHRNMGSRTSGGAGKH